MADFISLDDVGKMGQQPGAASGPSGFISLADVSKQAGAAEDKAFRDFILKRETTDMAYGMRRGVRDVINTGAELLATGYDKLTGADRPTLSSLVTGQKPGEGARIEAMNRAEREAATDGRPTTPGSVLGYVGGNTLATAPAIGAMSAGLGATGLPVLRQLGNAIQSGGFSTGRTGGGAIDMALRSIGGGINGFTTAGLADQDSGKTGALIGALLPPGVQLAGKGADMLAQALRTARMPGDVKAARDIAGLSGADVRNLDEVARVRDLLRQEGPQIIPGQQSVPEILQSPGVSQLQRSVQAVQPAPFAARAAEREGMRREVLERIAPIGPRQEVAQEVGNNIADYAIPAHQQAKKGVTAAFNSVDPFNESRVLLPIDQMRAAKDKFIGPGTFGSGGSAQQAINEAERIGTEALPGIRQAAQGRQPQDIAQAVRALGGINPDSAGGMNKEIAELTRKQTGTTGLVSRNGRTIDQVAEHLHERGFLESPDPAELLDALRGNVAGRKVYGADVVEDAFRGRLERSMGDAPQAGNMPKPVTFEELQNLRSSIGEQWRAASRSGNAREAAALDSQRRAIDQALENLSAGNGQAGEYFAPDMVANYKEARGLHAAKEQRFKTGPQAALFRRGGDNLPMVEGAEVPRRFFNGNASQTADAESFRRLVANDPRMMDELRRFAVSDAASQTDRFGNLTNAKFNRWLESRSGAIGGTFTEQQRAWLKSIAEDLRRSDLAENLGRSGGSDTAQKAASMMRLGLVDSPAARFVANNIPLGRTALDYLGAASRTSRADRFAGLLTDAPRTAGLLDNYIAAQTPQMGGLLGRPINPLLYPAAPVLLTGGTR